MKIVDSIAASLPRSAVGRAILFFMLTIWLSPTIQLMATHGLPPHGLSDVLIMLLPDLALSCVVIAFFLHTKSPVIKPNALDYLVLGFILVNVFWGFLINDNPVNAFKGFRITYLPISFYFLGRMWNPKAEELTKTFKSLFFVFVIMALLGWIIWLFLPDLIERMYDYSGHPVAEYFIVRMSSLLWTPVLFGTLMAWASYYYFWQTIRNETFWNKHLLMLLITFSALVMSVSRGPLLSFFGVLLVLAPFFKYPRKSFLLFGILVFFQSLISLSVNGNLDFQVWMVRSTASTLGLERDVTRVNRWEKSFNAFLEQPMGYGLGNAGAVAYNSNNTTVKKAALSTDGWYLKLACETGIPGLISFFILAVSFFVSLWKNREQSTQILGFSALGLALMIVIQSITSNVFDFYPYIALFWMILGLSIQQKTSS